VAVQATLRQLVEGLKDAGLEDALIEFRQTYIGPATAPYGNLLRAGDCPADAVVNRRSVVDTRMIAAGQAVHADPVLWDHRAGPEPVARQLLNAYFGVPQISMPLSAIPQQQRQAVSVVLASWMATRKTVLAAPLKAGLPSENYPVIEARSAGRSVVGVYQPSVVEIDLGGLDELTLLNATIGDRVVIRWKGAAPRRIVGEARTATGEKAASIDVVAVPGIVELGIPVSGIASMRVLDA
jgi:alpha-galactosidase